MVISATGNIFNVFILADIGEPLVPLFNFIYATLIEMHRAKFCLAQVVLTNGIDIHIRMYVCMKKMLVGCISSAYIQGKK
jgi:hypothetical protein